MYYKLSLIVIIFLYHQRAITKYLWQYTMVATVIKRKKA